MIVRRIIGWLLACLLVFTVTFAEEPTDQKQPTLDKNDPLLQALQQLQREVEQLRGELRGASPSRSMDSFNDEPETASRQSPETSRQERVTITTSKSDHWSFQPVKNPPLPSIANENWMRDDLDRFILAELAESKLQPNPDADRYTLIRRVSFDLTGLPPTEKEIRSFVDDTAPLGQALATVVDRYLDSDGFGERWGRHWLDVVRYADSVGRNWNAPFTYAWRYRDYVIDSFNDDKPYDQFVTEQLAGDLLAATDLKIRREQLVATGFLALGPTDIIVPEGEKLMMDRIDEQIDVMTRGMLGLTVACARCHDHKYEPVTMRDYYALAGVFYSTETLSGQRRGNYVDDDDLRLLPSKDGRKSPIPGVHSMADMQRMGWREILWTTDPNLAMGVAEGRVEDCPIRTDGDYYKRGPTPPRGDFHFAGLSGLGKIRSDESGRLQLARWMTSPDNPLTARVMVNRVWQHLFGRGLVPTVDNFGVSGQPASHPELLDHLASRFMSGTLSLSNGKPKASVARLSESSVSMPDSESQATPDGRLRLAVKRTKPWSVKSLIRSIVLSRTYRMSSAGQTAAQQIDPGNELYWRMNVRRLELEAVRDSMLDVAGRLTLRRPEGIQVAGRGGKGKWGVTRSLLSIDSPYRTVYLPVLRSLLPEMYSTFDFPNPTQIKGQREVTTVAPQALFLMNSEFSASCATEAARRLLNDSRLTNADRVRWVYLRLLGRPPDQDEVKTSIEFVNSLTGGDSESYRWSALIQALMISGEFRSVL